MKDRGLPWASFGRAAKLVAVYLKTLIVVGPDGKSPAAGFIHPPIDRQLLQKIAKTNSVPDDLRLLCRKTSWTKIEDATKYDALIEELQKLTPAGEFWRLEEYWGDTDNGDDL